MEARFLAEQGITRIAMPLADAAVALSGAEAHHLKLGAPDDRFPQLAAPHEW
jgi:hypothetical protein